VSAWPPPEALVRAQREARGRAERVRLVVHQARGRTGALLGRGTGDSVEYEDHRAYVPGDDPRHVDWNAYARSGQWVSKVFRAEVTPKVDLAFDASASMAAFNRKMDCAIGLFYLVLEGARRVGASVRVHVVEGEAIRDLALDAVDAGRWLGGPAGDGARAALGRVPWRLGALRVWVSDMLFVGAPDALLRPLGAGAGRAAVLAPYAAEEADPAWQGNLTMVDVESQAERIQRLTPALLARYREAYRQHFAGLRDAGRRLGIPVARVRAEEELVSALRAEVFPAGVLEPCR
jgi:uncharacterized protein (DUF58 family)